MYKAVIIVEKEEFIRRLTELRMKKGTSARDMSLSLGQSPGYINNIENGVNLPSMTVFFYICEYLEITPKDFFDIDNNDPVKINKLVEASKELNSDELDHIITVINDIRKYK